MHRKRSLQVPEKATFDEATSKGESRIRSDDCCFLGLSLYPNVNRTVNLLSTFGCHIASNCKMTALADKACQRKKLRKDAISTVGAGHEAPKVLLWTPRESYL